MLLGAASLMVSSQTTKPTSVPLVTAVNGSVCPVRSAGHPGMLVASQRPALAWSLRYAVGMRYAQGGGLGPRDQAARERIRMLAAQGFDRGEKNRVIAKELRVSVRSVECWRRAWREQAPWRCVPPDRPSDCRLLRNNSPSWKPSWST
ncbi:helix-turn-helix domain-containing protein [Streptomyces sp. NPDC056390]|uniref:helix-turn-helix domain-containing protein n=1 Tax=Streptomyces sp. NPDC056390 TaxID=3345806 RepID=UPI0035DB6F8B